MKGLGCDVCGVSRMEELLSHEQRLSRVFTEAEQQYIFARVRAAETAAGLFAAKEALVKALGTGFQGLFVSDIEIGHTDAGAPYYVMNEKTLVALAHAGVQSAFLSISHDAGVAMAVAVLE